MESTLRRSAVRLNGGVDCLVVKIALGGRFFAAHLSIKCGKGEDCIGKHFCLLVAKSWPIFFYHFLLQTSMLYLLFQCSVTRYQPFVRLKVSDFLSLKLKDSHSAYNLWIVLVTQNVGSFKACFQLSPRCNTAVTATGGRTSILMINGSACHFNNRCYQCEETVNAT